MLRGKIDRLRKSKAFLNTLCSVIFFVSNTLWIFVSLPVVIHFLDKTEVGIWVIVNALVGYLLYLDLGLSYAVSRVIAPSLVSKDQGELDIWWSNAKAILWVQFLIIVLLGLSGTSLFLAVFEIEGSYQSNSAYLLQTCLCVSALGVPLRGVPGLLNAQERFYWVPLVGAVAPWLNFAVLVVFLADGAGLRAFPNGMLAAQVFTWVAYSLLVKKGSLIPRSSFRLVSASRLKKLFKFSTGLMVIGLVEVVLRNLPSLILGKIGGISKVPQFNFTAKGPILGSDLVLRAFQAFQPGWQSAFVSGDHQSFKKKYRIAGTIALGVATIGAAATLALNSLFLQTLIGGTFFAGPMVNVWVATGVITVPMAMYFHSMITLSGKVGIAPVVAVGKLLVAFGGGLLGWQLFGLSGLAASFALAPLINGIFGYLAGSKSCGFRVGEVAPQLPLLTVICVALVIVSGFVTSELDETWATLTLFGRQVDLPGPVYFLPPALLALGGFIIIYRGIRAKGNQ